MRVLRLLNRTAGRIAVMLGVDWVPFRNRILSASREAFAFAFRWSGLPFLIRATWTRRKVGILVYHNPEPEVLDRHLGYASRRFTFIALDELVRAIRTRDWSEIPPNSLVLTIDDGHRGNLRLADVLARHRVRATMFVCTQIVNTGRRYWWTVDGLDRKLVWNLPNAERLRVMRERYGYDQTANYEPRQALSSAELATMDAVVDLQAHTRFHPILTTCSDAEAAEEITGCKPEVEGLSGKPCRHFSYPNGAYGEREIALVRSAGYESARTTDVGWNDVDTDLFRLKIIGMPDGAALNAVAVRLSGIRWAAALWRHF